MLNYYFEIFNLIAVQLVEMNFGQFVFFEKMMTIQTGKIDGEFIIQLLAAT